ncbi:MAG: efflux RND transporter periplasmic adaptor subunit [Desulfobulbales bacterium]|nr:efflux RND transporter periplasmic adaptor subunit [Desulfobulbales bacterium]
MQLIIVLLGCAMGFAQEPPPAKVVVAAITQQEVAENRPFIGRLYYDTASQISAEVSGLVEIVAVREGDLVKKDAPLLRLNTELLDREIDIKLAEIEQIDLRIGHAEKQYRRLESLYEKEGISEKAYEDALYAYEDGRREKQVAELELKKLLLDLEKGVVKAPYEGMVMAKNVDSGDWVQPGKPLLRLGSVNDLFVKVPIGEKLLQFVETGSRVVVGIEASGQELQGTVEGIDPVADPKTKNVFVKVRIPAQKNIAENLSARVYLPVGARKRLSIIPRDALVSMGGNDFVYTIKEGKAAILPVNIVSFLGDAVGADNPHFREGMEVVVEGNERLRFEQPVVVSGGR